MSISGVFETLRTEHGRTFDLDRHLARAEKSAKLLGLDFPSKAEIAEDVAVVLERDKDVVAMGRLRINFNRDGAFEIRHEAYEQWKAPAKLTKIDAPVDTREPLTGHKTLPYTANLAALEIASRAGFDEGLRINERGEVAEGTISNLIAEIDGQWVTPPLLSGCLPGITRELAIEKLSVTEAVILPADLDRATSLFIATSLRDLQPVAFLDSKPLSIGKNSLQLIANFAKTRY
jgi:branched-chain amino acid aminotransferase